MGRTRDNNCVVDFHCLPLRAPLGRAQHPLLLSRGTDRVNINEIPIQDDVFDPTEPLQHICDLRHSIQLAFDTSAINSGAYGPHDLDYF